MKIYSTFITLIVISSLVMGAVSIFVFQELDTANAEFANFEAKNKEVLTLERLDRQIHRVWVMAMFFLEAQGIPEEEEEFSQELNDVAMEYNTLFEEINAINPRYNISPFVKESEIHDEKVSAVLDAGTSDTDQSRLHDLIKEGRASGSEIIEMLDSFQIKANNDAREAERGYLASVKNVVDIAFPLILLTFIVIIAVVFFFMHSLIISISKIKSTTSEYGKGKFDAKIDITANNEIGQLSRALEKMAVDLKRKFELQKYSKRLEEEVQRRTNDLRTKVDQLEKYGKVTVGREIKMADLKKKIKELELELRKKK